MSVMYLPPLLDVTVNRPILSEEIFPLIGNILINTMFSQTTTSSGMGFGAIITLDITLLVIICLVYWRFLYFWQRCTLSLLMILGKHFSPIL